MATAKKTILYKIYVAAYEITIYSDGSYKRSKTIKSQK